MELPPHAQAALIAGGSVTSVASSALGWLVAQAPTVTSSPPGPDVFFLTALGGAIAALSPLVLRIIEGWRLKQRVDELERREKSIGRALAEDREWMIRATMKHPDLVLPERFGRREFDPGGYVTPHPDDAPRTRPRPTPTPDPEPSPDAAPTVFDPPADRPDPERHHAG